jgi:catecholate siderophore receptor
MWHDKSPLNFGNSPTANAIPHLYCFRFMNEPNLKPLAALLMTQGLAAVAHAQSTNAPSTTDTNATLLPDVVVQGQRGQPFKVDQVSSPKFTQPLLDTPQTIVAIPKEVYTQQGATTLSDVLRNTPGITFAAGEGGNVASGDSFFMRGTDISGNIFVDSVRDAGGYSRDVYNLEQVEIFKGPSGADNGRGGTSGYINMATKSPKLQPGYSGILSYGSAEQKRLTADLNQPLDVGEKGDWINSTSLRLNGLWQDGGVPERDFVENNRWAIAPSLGFGLGTPTRIILSGSYLEQDNLPDSGLPIVALPSFGLGVDQDNYYGLARHDYDDVQSGRFTARIEHDLIDSLTLRSQSSYVRTDRDALTTYFQNSSTTPTTFNPATVPVNPATGAIPPNYTSFNPGTGTVTPRRLHNETENEIYFQQFSVNTTFSTLGVEHDLGGGLDLTREQQFTPTWQPVGGPATSVFSPDPYRAVTVAQIPYRATNNPYADAQVDTLGVYAFDTVTLNKYFLLNGSVRFEHYDVEYESRTPSATGDPSPTVQRLEVDDDLLSWKAGIVFKPIENGSLYFSYGNSFTPPGSSFTLSSTASNQNSPNLDPQEAQNFEVGTKWDFFGGRLSTSLAAYHSENLNIVSTDANTGEVTQSINETVEGIEFGISGRITKDWFVYGGFGLAESERESAGTTAEGTTDGAALRFFPEVSASLWTAYKLPFGLTLGGGVQYVDSVVRSTANDNTPTATTIAEVPNYVLLNAMVAYDVNKNCTLRLNLNNLTDEEDNFRLNNNGGRYYPSGGLSFLLSAELRF